MISSTRWLRFGTLATTVMFAFFLSACANPLAHPLSASDILSKAQSVLKDATYSSSSSSGATANPVQFTANGKLTTSPNRTDTTFKFNIAGSTVTIEQITDGQVIYERIDPETTWQKLSATDPNAGMIGTTEILNFGKLQQVTLVGTESINGASTYHLKANVDVPVSQGKETEELWIRQDNFYPQQIVQNITGQTNSSSPISISGDFTLKIIFSKWNTGLKIDLPSPDQTTSGG